MSTTSNTATRVASPLLYLTTTGKIGLFVRREGFTYVLKINGVEQTYHRDTLAYVPAEKLQLFKRLAK